MTNPITTARRMPRPYPWPRAAKPADGGSAAGHRRQDLDLAALAHRRLQAVGVADVLAVDVDVDEATQLAVVVADALAQVRVLGVDAVEHLADGRARGRHGGRAAHGSPQLGRE